MSDLQASRKTAPSRKRFLALALILLAILILPLFMFFSLISTREVIRRVKLTAICKNCSEELRIEYKAVPARVNAEDELANVPESQFFAVLDDTVEIKIYGIYAFGLFFQQISYDKYLALRIHNKRGDTKSQILFVDETALKTKVLPIQILVP